MLRRVGKADPGQSKVCRAKRDSVANLGRRTAGRHNLKRTAIWFQRRQEAGKGRETSRHHKHLQTALRDRPRKEYGGGCW